MLHYWEMNNIVRPDYRPLPRIPRQRIWIGRVTTQHARACAPVQDENPAAHQAWTERLDQHFRDQALQILQDLEDEDQIDAVSSDAEPTSGSTSPVSVDTEDEEYELQVRQETRRFRVSEPGTLFYL